MDYSPEWGDSARQCQLRFAIFSNLKENRDVFTQPYLTVQKEDIHQKSICIEITRNGKIQSRNLI